MSTSEPTILVVEDEPVTRLTLTALLQQQGYEVDTAADGETALERIALGGLSLVLLDRMLPNVDGVGVCRRVRIRGVGPYLPIIMVTALDHPDERHEGFMAGADDYVTKPFNHQELLDRVGVWIRTSQRLQALHEAEMHEWRSRHDAVLRPLERRLRSSDTWR
jgi:DNA-binding response OmpR family regulator